MKKSVLFLLKAGISISLIAFFLNRFEWSDLKEAFSSANPRYLALAVGLFLVSNFLGALQWRELLRAQSISLPIRKIVSLYFVGVFFNNFLVSNIGGDAVRVYDLKRLTNRGTAGFAATFADRFLGLFVLSAFSVAAYAASPALWNASLLTPIVALSCSLAGVLCFGFSRRLSGRVIAVVGRILPGRITEVLSNIRDAFIQYRSAYGVLGRAAILSAGVQVCRVGVYFTVGRSLSLDVGFLTHLVFIPLIAVVAALPISFGGIGVRENLGAVLYGQAGQDPAAALAMMFLGYLCGIAASLVGGVQFILHRHDRTSDPETESSQED